MSTSTCVCITIKVHMTWLSFTLAPRLDLIINHCLRVSVIKIASRSLVSKYDIDFLAWKRERVEWDVSRVVTITTFDAQLRVSQVKVMSKQNKEKEEKEEKRSLSLHFRKNYFKHWYPNYACLMPYWQIMISMLFMLFLLK